VAGCYINAVKHLDWRPKAVSVRRCGLFVTDRFRETDRSLIIVSTIGTQAKPLYNFDFQLYIQAAVAEDRGGIQFVR